MSSVPETRADKHLPAALRWQVLSYFAILATAAQAARWVRSSTIGRASQFVDDGYYYFGIARHIARGDGSTFGALDHTNGYHPMWLLVLIPLFALIPNRSHVLFGVKLLSGLLWLAALRQVQHIARRANATVAFAIGLGPITIYSTMISRSLPFAGVETGLVLVALLWAIRLVTQGPGSPRDDWRLAVVCAVAVASRLDAVVAAGAFVLYESWQSQGSTRERVRAAVRQTAPMALVIVLQAAINRIWFGSFITVSTRAKSLSGRGKRHVALHDYFFDPRSLPTVVGIGSISLVVVGVTFFMTRRHRNRDETSVVLHRLAHCLVMLWGAEFFTVAIFDSQSSWPQWPWYFYGSFIALMLAPGIMIASIFPTLDSRVSTAITTLRRSENNPQRRQTRPHVVSTVAAILTTCILGTVLGASSASLPTKAETFYEQNAIALSLDPPSVDHPKFPLLSESIPKGAVIAMGDRAGVIGYFLDRPMVQLEGIVNSNEFLDALDRGSAPAFLRDRHVTYYAKSSHVPDRYPLEVGGGPETGTPECGPRFEPFFGIGNKLQFNVCRRDIVYQSSIANGEQLVVWRITRPPTTFRV